jgi:hypothetical protein
MKIYMLRNKHIRIYLNTVKQRIGKILFGVLACLFCHFSMSAQTTLIRSIAASSDDAEELGTNTAGDMYLISTDLELVEDANLPAGTQKVGLRFLNISIPKGAIITGAYLNFIAMPPDAPNTNSGITNLVLNGHKVSNSPTFSSTAFDITNRLLSATNASANWSPTAWTTGESINSPSIISIIQEIVDQDVWVSGNAISVFVTGAGSRTAASWNNAGTGNEPKLTISYTLPLILTSAVTNTTTPGSSDGAIDFSVSGGEVPYTYLWSNGNTTQDLTNLEAGTYSVTVTDNIGFTKKTIVTVGTAADPNTVIKQLYLSDPSRALDRIDPVTTNDSTTAVFAAITADIPKAVITQSGAPVVAKGIGNVVTITNYSTGAGSDKLLLVGVSWAPYELEAITSMKYGTTDMILVPSSYVLNSNRTAVAMYYIVNPVPGPLDIVATFNDPVQEGIVMGAVTYTGVNQTTPLGTAKNSTGTSTLAALSGISSGADELVFGVEGNRDDVIAIAVNGENKIWEDYQGSRSDGIGFTKTGSASVTSSFTLSTSMEWAMTAVSIKPRPAISGNPLVTFTESPALCSDLTIKGGQTIEVNAYISNLIGTMPASPSVSAQIKYGVNNVITLNTASYNSISGTLFWSGIITGDLTIPAGQSIELLINSMQQGVTFDLEYDSKFKPSKINLPVSNFIDITSFVVIDPPDTVTAVNNGNLVYLRTTVTDPFGFSDITGLDIRITDPVGAYSYVTADSISTSGCTRNFEYSWVSPNTPGDYSFRATAKEGTEDSVVDMAYLNFSLCPITVNVVVTNKASCLNDGEITFSVPDGNGPYNWSWSRDSPAGTGSGSGTVIGNLAAGSYTITVTAASGCTGTAFVTIAPNPIVTKAFITDVSCFGQSNGAIIQNPTGGTSPYTYLWDNGSTEKDIDSLTTGSYAVTITDAIGCTDFKSYTISQPAILDASAIINQPECGLAGSISLSVSGGTLPYSFLWNDGSTSKNRSGLSPGNYSVAITDAAGCTKILTSPLADPNCGSGLIVCKSNAAEVFYTELQQDVDFYNWIVPLGASIVSGQGTPNIVVNWNGASTGIGQICVNTENSCGESSYLCQDVIITEVVAEALADPPTCADQDLILHGNGGSSYNWTGPNGFTSNQQNPVIYDATVIDSGTYSLTVNNAAGCVATATVAVAMNVSATLSAVVTTSDCGQSIGAVNLTISGGTSPFTYNWSSGETTEDISNITGDNYNVQVTDANGCITSLTGSVGDLSGPSLSLTSTDAYCFNGTNGLIDMTVTGGTGPITFFWSNGAETQNLSGLSAGNYSVIATDKNGCIGTGQATVSEPNPFQLNADRSPINCFGGNNGAINLSVFGGTPGYTYDWSTIDGSGLVNGNKNQSGLTAGTYQVTVTDSVFCTTSMTIEITEPLAPILANSIVGNVLCNGDSNGIINLNVAGGTYPYTYLWSNGADTKNISNISIGTYTVTITDSKGCFLSDVLAEVLEPPILELSSTQTDVLCFSESTGSIDLTVVGGTAPYTYSWSNGAISEDVNGLLAGIYSVTVMDANNCQVTSEIIITEKPILQASYLKSDNTCFGGSIGSIDLTIAGGTPGYTYSWSGGLPASEDQSNLTEGVYSVTVTDVNLCVVSTLINIRQPEDLLVTQFLNQPLCFGGNDGTITLNVRGGVSPYSYVWNDGSITKDRTNLLAGNYTVTVSDSNYCEHIETVIVDQPAVLNANGIVTDVTCLNERNGSIDLSVSGGIAPYTFAWSNGLNTEDIDSLTSGDYQVTVKDFNLCETIVSFTVSEPAILTVTGDVVPNCPGQTNGTIDLLINGGNSIFSFLWSDLSTLQNRTNLSPGLYSVMVTDNKGCTASESYELVQLDVVVSSLNQSCLSDDGQAFASPTGGLAPYTYVWSNGETTQNISNLASGSFTITVTDVLGCNITKEVILTAPICIGPVAQNDIDTTQFNTPISGTVAPLDPFDPGYDSDPDNTLAELEFYPLSSVDPLFGNIIWNDNFDGGYTFTPSADFYGNFSVKYRVCDPLSLCSDATLTIVVDPLIEPDTIFINTLSSVPYTLCPTADDIYAIQSVEIQYCSGFPNFADVSVDINTGCLIYTPFDKNLGGIDSICVIGIDAFGKKDTTVFILTTPTQVIKPDTIYVTGTSGTPTAALCATADDISNTESQAVVIQAPLMYGDTTTDLNGCVIYRPYTNNPGGIDSILVIGTDSLGRVDTTVFIIKVCPIEPIVVCSDSQYALIAASNAINVTWFKDGNPSSIGFGNTLSITASSGTFRFTSSNNVSVCPIKIQTEVCCIENCIPIDLRKIR